MRSRAFALIAPFLFAARASNAQGAAPLVARDPVRISAPALGLTRSPATFVAIRRDSVVVRLAAADAALAGALLDAGIGSFVRIARFKTVTLAPQLTASVALSRRSAGLRFTLHL